MKLKNLILILIAVLVVGGLIYWANAKKAEKLSSPTPTPTPTTPTASPTVPSDWKTYRNEEYGFEFQYPSVGKIVETPSRNPNYRYLIAIDLTSYPNIYYPESDYLNAYLSVILQAVNPDHSQPNFATESGIEGTLDSYTAPSKLSLRRGNGAVIFQFGCGKYCLEGSRVLIEIGKTFRFINP